MVASSPARKLTFFGLVPASCLVISALVPTGLPPNRKPYCRTVVRKFSSAMSGAGGGCGADGADRAVGTKPVAAGLDRVAAPAPDGAGGIPSGGATRAAVEAAGPAASP